MGLPPFRRGIEFPNPDFAAFARACGGHGFRVTKPGELHAGINDALKADGPAIVDVVVAADEMPNLPHVSLETARQYAVAKIKEAVLAVIGCQRTRAAASGTARRRRASDHSTLASLS